VVGGDPWQWNGARRRRLMRSAYLLCGDQQIAEDLLRMTMLRTARRWRVARSAPEPYARAVLITEFATYDRGDPAAPDPPSHSSNSATNFRANPNPDGAR
jgi:DNA-directed RNA polymerase specialized sigma24 family protein